MAVGETGFTFHRRSSSVNHHDRSMGKVARKDSYVRSNYHCQVQINSNTLFPVFLDEIDRIKLPNPQLGPVTVAEFGSSSSQSSVDNVRALLQRLKRRYGKEEIGQEPEYQVFFQDLPATDFNALVKLLNATLLSNEEAETVDCFAAAVPGSIYGRLFPYSTLQFAFTTFALNCLSKIPESVSDRSSPAYNGGQTGLHRSSVATMEAYSAQAKEDLCSFLSARADEMADDGVLCLNFRCRDSESDSTSYSTPHEMMGDCIWDDFVDKGIISASMRDSFNPSRYWRSVREIKEVLAEFMSEFQIHRQLVRQVLMPAAGGASTTAITTHSSEAPSPPLPPAYPTKSLPAVSSATLRAHFGKEATNLYLERYEQALMEGIANQALSHYHPNTWLVLILIRKPREFDDF